MSTAATMASFTTAAIPTGSLSENARPMAAVAGIDETTARAVSPARALRHTSPTWRATSRARNSKDRGATRARIATSQRMAAASCAASAGVMSCSQMASLPQPSSLSTPMTFECATGAQPTNIRYASRQRKAMPPKATGMPPKERS